MLNDQDLEKSSPEDRRRPLGPTETQCRAYAGSRRLCVDPTRTASAISINSLGNGEVGGMDGKPTHLRGCGVEF